MTAPAPPDTRSRILDAALELFSEHGFDGTTLQQIADRLGLTKAALYYHFHSKDDLLDALIRPAMTDLNEVLDSYDDSSDTPARRRHFTRDYLDYLLRHRRLMSYISRDLVTLGHPAITTGSRERRTRIEALLAGDGLDFDDQVRTAMAFGGFQAVISQYPDADLVELREALLDAAGMLLRARPRQRKPATVVPVQPTSEETHAGA